MRVGSTPYPKDDYARNTTAEGLLELYRHTQFGNASEAPRMFLYLLAPS